MRNTLYCIVGRTSSGKDTLAKKIVSTFKDISIIVSYTTRPIRDYETDGVDHWFITEEDYIEKYADKEKLAYTEINGYRYFTLKDDVLTQKKNIYIIDPNGLKEIYANKSGYHIRCMYVRANDYVRRERYESRESNVTVPFGIRNAREKDQFDEFEKSIENKEFKVDLMIYTDGSGKNKLNNFDDDVLSDIYYMLKMDNDKEKL